MIKGDGISSLAALTGDQRLTPAYKKAVNETIAELEAEVHTRRHRAGHNESTRAAGDPIWAEFIHMTGRRP